MRLLIALTALVIAGCVTTSDIMYTNFQPSTDKNGNKTFEFYYTKAMTDSYTGNGGNQAMLDFFIPKYLAEHAFCQSGYTLLDNMEIKTNYFVQHGICK